ncbi:hypothetical protein BGZ65_000723 [Modicella reniformis]|uniref:Ion transport domain-containing protein n=1 Tax=Modicella reniformis TaxID=1440133 RepID=A0A9P6SUG9_9FUNG|nr:hypothetical protein BGZ65_000723 [Modicella reniformis]
MGDDCIVEVPEGEALQYTLPVLSTADRPQLTNTPTKHLENDDAIDNDSLYDEKIRQQAKQGRIYNVRIAMNLEHLVVDSIESITFSHSDLNYNGALEVFMVSKSRTLVLELHYQHYEDGFHMIQQFDMEIRTSHTTSLQNDTGYIELYYMELHAFQLGVVDGGTVFKPHKPFLVSINVGHKDPEDSHAPTAPAKIINYAVSRDGSHIATLSSKDEYLQLDMWDLELHSTNMDYERRAPFMPKSCAQHQATIPREYTKKLSVSFDGSKVTLMDGSRGYLPEPFKAFSFNKANYSDEKQWNRPQRKLLLMGDEISAQLKDFRGFGKFHFMSSKEQAPEDELFITCDGLEVVIYGVHGKWEMIRTITLSTLPISEYGRLIEGLGGKYFSWSDGDDNFTVCNLETGRLIYPMATSRGTAYFSRDGSLMICLQANNAITTGWTESGSMLGTSNSFKHASCQVFPAFVNNDEQFIVPLINPDNRFGLGSLGMMLDTTTLSITERVSLSTYQVSQQPQGAGVNGQYLYSLHGSKLDLVKLQDIVVPPYPQLRYQCDRWCLSGLTKLKKPDIVRPTSDAKRTVITLSPNLDINIEFGKAGRSKNVVVSVSSKQGKPREALNIPSVVIDTNPGKVMEYKFYVDRTNHLLIVCCTQCIMVWKLPSTLKGKATLQLTWGTEECVQTDIESNGDRREVELAVCDHGQPYAGIWEKSDFIHTWNLRRDDLLGSEIYRFISGLFILITMFESGDTGFQQGVLQYVGRYVNRTVEYDDEPMTVLTIICKGVTQMNYELYNRFLKTLLHKDHVRWVRWVPKPGLSRELNPISILLQTTKAVPRAINLAWIVIDYCIRMAKDEQDPQFLSPILDSLKELLKMRKLYPDHVLSTLRRLAFIHVKEKSYVIDRAIIAHPPWSRWRFGPVNEESCDSDPSELRWRWRIWDSYERPIYKCEDPVFQLDKSPQFKKHDPQNDKFTRDVFVASFDMLWNDPDAKPDTKLDSRSSIERIRDNRRSPPSWGQIVLFIIWEKCKIKPGCSNRVKCYDIPLEALDNPAIAALIEYKWNTIGYKYWLARFTFQCAFYLLVLFAVFMQVYDTDHTFPLMSVFIAIIMMAVSFLWLELQQLLNNGTLPYVKSPYNWIDIATFSLPLSGSICQIVNILDNDAEGNISTLSFSVLFIFLHFLFELRVKRSVCQFVTVIVRTLSNLQIFIIIFFAGIVAFAIAILHLFRGCPANICDDSGVKYPFELLRAISSTYFFMGGIWDSTSDNFNSDNWAFHTMMIMYFFFTSILLLNVLISLINEAFDDAKETWHLVWMENRLRYIEGAEAIANSIPGFREAHLFPKEIYYSATIQQQKAYHYKYFKHKNDDLSGDVDNDSSSQKQAGKKSPSGTGVDTMTTQSNTTDLEAVKQNQEELKRLQESHHKEQKQNMDKLKKDLKEEVKLEMKQELQQTQNQLRALQSQLTTQQTEFKEQLTDIKMFLSAVLEARVSEQRGQSGSTATMNQIS